MSQLALLVDGVIVQLFPLEKSTVTIGRSFECDICIDDAGVSSKHAEIRIVPNEFIDGHDDVFIEDLDSRNGTRVNEKKVRQCQLKPDDVITIAWNRFKLLDDKSQGGESTILIMNE